MRREPSSIYAIIILRRKIVQEYIHQKSCTQTTITVIAWEHLQDVKLPELLPHCLAFQGFHVEVVGLGRHNEKHHHRDVTFMHLMRDQNTQQSQWPKMKIKLVADRTSNLSKQCLKTSLGKKNTFCDSQKHCTHLPKAFSENLF